MYKVYIEDKMGNMGNQPNNSTTQY